MSFSIGTWYVDQSSGLLHKDDQQVRVSPRAMDVLCHLAENAGKTVAIADLLERCWPNSLVGNNAVYKVISELRAAFGEKPSQPIYLFGIPKKGYRLVLGDPPSQEVRKSLEVPAAASAREAFKKGVYQRRRLDIEGLISAKALFEEAIEQDQTFADAYVELSNTLWELSIFQLRPGQRNALRNQYVDLLGQFELVCPNSPHIAQVRLQLQRLTHATLPDVEAGIRQQYLEDNTYHEFFLKYGELLLAARLPSEALQYSDKYSELCPDDPYRSIYRGGILRDMGDIDGCLNERRRVLDRFPNEIGTLTGIVVELTKYEKEFEAQHYLSLLKQADAEGFWYTSANLYMKAIKGELTKGDVEEASRLGVATQQLHGALSFIQGDVESGCMHWRSLEPELLMTTSRYIIGIEFCMPSQIKDDARYQALLDQLGLGRRWTEYLSIRVNELSPLTGIALTTSNPDLARLRMIN